MSKQYILNSKPYLENELLDFAHSQLTRKTISPWEIDLYKFIIEWFSDSLFISINTSGSTGKPKPIELLKSDMRLSAQRTINYFELSKGNSLLLCLSVKYIAGMMMVVRTFEGEMNLICVSPQQIENNNFGVTPIDFAAVVPLQLEQLVNNKSINSFNKIIIGGTALSNILAVKLMEVFTGKAYETYGMTESITHVAIAEVKPNSSKIFHALPQVSFAIDERDCLIIHDKLFNNRSFITNDRIQLLSESSFRLLGRVDNVINSGGLKVQPEEIESILSPFIKNKLLVTSIADSSLGNMIVLVIEKGENIALIQKAISEHIPTYKQPKKIIEIDNIPINANGKVDFTALKNLL